MADKIITEPVAAADGAPVAPAVSFIVAFLRANVAGQHLEALVGAVLVVELVAFAVTSWAENAAVHAVGVHDVVASLLLA